MLKLSEHYMKRQAKQSGIKNQEWLHFMESQNQQIKNLYDIILIFPIRPFAIQSSKVNVEKN